MSNDEQGMISSGKAMLHNRLRRLQENSRLNIPAMMMQRAASSFSLQAEPAPDVATGRAAVMVYPQDPFVGEPEVRHMRIEDIRPGLVNARVQVQDSAGDVAWPDSEGHYLFMPGSREFDQVNSFYYTTFTLRMYERYARRAIPWSFSSPRLTIDPHVGDEANAFYNEQDRMLGFHSFIVDGRKVSTATSADIVSHEAAHAVLDGIRDLYNESFGLGANAFHEAFGDMTAVLVALHDDSLVRRLLKWTNGNLRLDSFVTAIAEQMASSLGADAALLASHTVYLRNALNDFQVMPFDELRYAPPNPDFEIGRDPHNYSRIFSGALYDILVGVYDQLRLSTHEHIAVMRARDIAGRLLMYALELGPIGEFDFSDMARAFLTADSVVNKGRYIDILKSVFDNRKILTQTAADHHLHALKLLPDLRLPTTLNSALSSALFLEEKVLPLLKLEGLDNAIPVSAYRNTDGYAFVNYFVSNQETLTGAQFAQFEGVGIDMFGGLTLMFDGEDQLRSAFYRPPTVEDVRQIRILITDLIQNGLIAAQLQPAGILRKAQPQALHVRDGDGIADESGHLVKYPVHFDNVELPPDTIGTYMKRLKAHLEEA